jgi:hypothetical protein
MARNMEDMLTMIAALVANADDERLGEATRAAYREKAESLMRKYRIEEESLIASDPGSIEPTMFEVEVSSLDSSFHEYHEALWYYVAQHCGIRYAYRWDSARRGYLAQAVGYETDLRYASFLFQSAKLMMIAKLEPKVDPKLSDKENIYRLRSAGIDRQTIAEQVFGKRGHAEGLKVGQIYKEACAEKGEEAAVSGRNVNAKTYRIAYAQEFTRRFAQRLRDARDAADAIGGVIELAGRQERVDEAFYTRFPSQRPKPASNTPQAPAKGRKSRAVKSWTKSDEARWQRFNNSPAAVAAHEAGRAAADSVQISRTTPRTQRVESPSEAYGKEIEG